MKICIFGDLHISRNDKSLSIDNPHNTADAFLWINQVATQEKCDYIISVGDLIDKDGIDAETSTILKNIFKNNKHKYILLLGNHEMKDSAGEYNSLNILDNYPNVEVINKLTIKSFGNKEFVFMPFTTKQEEIDKAMILMDNTPGDKILFSHGEYRNVPKIESITPGFIDYLQVSPRVEKIFNGHIHIALESEKFYQTGCPTGLNFSDQYPYHKPGLIIYDTDTGEIKRVENPNAILYIKTSYDELDNIKDFKNTHLRVDCPADKLKEANEKLENIGALSSKIKVIIDENTDLEQINKNNSTGDSLDLYTSPEKALIDFTHQEKSIYSEDELAAFIREYISGKKISTEEEV